MTHHRADEVLAFWFGQGADYGKRHKRWFEKDPGLDAEVARRYRDLCDQLAREHEWLDAPRQRLARAIVLGPIPRPIFPGTARALATHRLSLATPRPRLQRGDEARVLPD